MSNTQVDGHYFGHYASMSICNVMPCSQCHYSKHSSPNIAIGSAGDDVLLFSEGSSYCTSVVVGPKVIVTSAQCIDKTQLSHVAIVFVRNGSRSLSLHCDIGKGAEIALCNTDKPIPVSRIAKIAIGPVSDRVMTVLGYGCRDALLRNFDGVLSAATISITGRIDRLMNLLGVEACPGDAGGGIFGSAPSSRLYGIVIGNLDGRLVAASLLTRDFRGWGASGLIEIQSLFVGFHQLIMVARRVLWSARRSPKKRTCNCGPRQFWLRREGFYTNLVSCAIRK